MQQAWPCVIATELSYRCIVGASRPSTTERNMKKIQSVLVSAAVAIGIAAPASAATTDPEVIIYRFSGVRDDGSNDNFGVATVFHCTNFSGVTENIRFVTRANVGVIASNLVRSINHLSTLTAETHQSNANAFGGELVAQLATRTVAQGTTAIAATSPNIICTAMVIDGFNNVPTGVALRGIRFNPVPGSQE